MGGLGLCKAGEGIGQLWWDLNWAFMLDQGLYGPGTKPRFESRGAKAWIKKISNDIVYLKKKIMIDKTIALYYYKYLSQKGNNMNKKSWKLQYDIQTFSKKNRKRRGLRISKFWIIRINILILSHWPTHQYDKLIPLDATKNHTNEVFKTLFEDFKKLGY